MSEKNTNTTEELSTAEIAGVVLARMIVIPVITLAILALVTLSMFDTFASLPRISNAEFSHFVSTFPQPIHVAIFVVCGLLLLYGHFYTDAPVWEIITRQRTYPDESPKEDIGDES